MNEHTHHNSRAAHRQDAAHNATQRQLIFERLKKYSDGLSDREIAKLVGRDLRVTAPRITELIQQGWVIEIGRTACRVTGKTVRVTRVCTPAEHAVVTKERERLAAMQREPRHFFAVKVEGKAGALFRFHEKAVGVYRARRQQGEAVELIEVVEVVADENHN